MRSIPSNSIGYATGLALRTIVETPMSLADRDQRIDARFAAFKLPIHGC